MCSSLLSLPRWRLRQVSVLRVVLLEFRDRGDPASVFVVEWFGATLEESQTYPFPVPFGYVDAPVVAAFPPWLGEHESRIRKMRRPLRCGERAASLF